MVTAFTVVAFLVGFIPLGSFILIPMEVYLVYAISKKHDAFDFLHFIVITGVLIAASGFLKGLASFLHAAPVFGQFANSIVAAGVMFAIGKTAEDYYSKKRRS